MNDDVDRLEQIWLHLMEPVQETYSLNRLHLDALVHYTSFEGFQGIVESNEFWFSPVSAMNDIEEVRRGKRFIVENASAGRKAASSLFAIQRIDPELWQAMSNEFDARLDWDAKNTFISCWSECNPNYYTHDDLTMWRGYGNDGNGVAFVVNPDMFLLNRGYASEIIACPVSYETEAQFAARAANFFRAFAVNLLSLSSEERDNYRELVIQAFAEICFYLAISHKHTGFSREREWRFVWRRNPILDTDELEKFVLTKSSPSGMLERLCLPLLDNPGFAEGTLDLRKLISRIMVGPAQDMEASERALNNLLRKNGFDLSFTTVERSSIPYRAHAL